MMKRRDFISVLGGAVAAWPLAARAQQPGKIRRIGFLANDPTIPAQAAGKAFLEGLREQGFVEGKNIVIERRFAQGAPERSPELAAELVRLDLELIVTSGQNNVAALRQATKSIPVVMVNVFDPVGMGIVNSLALPGSNFTGLTSHVSPEMVGKRLQLLKDAFPRISRVAVLRTPSFPTDQMQWDALERAAPALNVRLIALPISGRNDLEGAFAALRRDRPDALFGSNGPATLIFRKQVAEFAAQERLPAMYPFTEVTEAGGLMSYGASRKDLFHRAAGYVAKILNGARPAQMPIEQPTKFELVINVKAANAIGVAIPREILLLADEVIE
jgi:putative tryptophan/tyrosine transport system substrate-binding protein